MNPPVVVDTNIIFAALVGRRSPLRETLLMEAGAAFGRLASFLPNCSNTRSASWPQQTYLTKNCLKP
jgi:hypothetical protein